MASDRSRRQERRRTSAASARAGATAARVAEVPAIEPATGARAALVLAVALAILALLRTAAAFDPTMRWWGANALRFTAPWFGVWPWALLLLAFVPAVARPVAARLAVFGDALVARAPAALGGFAALTMLMVAVFPDRLWLVGDFLLRLGGSRGQIPVNLVFPQALPLDLYLHHHVPVAIARAGIADPNAWERVLGTIEAGLLALASAEFARRFGLRGAAAACCAGAIVCSGALGMFTGYGKAFVELTLITVATAAAALRVVREGKGAWNLAGLLVIGLLLHRSALALFVTLAATAWIWWRTAKPGPGERDPRGRASTLAAFAAPIVAGLVCAPIIVASMRVTDVRHLAPAGTSLDAIVGATFAPAHLSGVANLLMLAAPLAFAAPFLVAALAAPLRARGRESLVIAALVLPALAVLFLVHPRQGLFRDTDVFAPALAALAVAAAALAGEALRGAPARAWLATPVLMFALLTTTQSLSLAADVNRGTARVRAYLEGPPRSADEERALLWTYLAERLVGLRRPDDAVVAFERAAELAPSPRILMEWALAEEDRPNPRAAQRVYRRVIERAPTFTEAWYGLAGVSILASDWSTAREALARAAELEPARPELAELRRRLAAAAPAESLR